MMASSLESWNVRSQRPVASSTCTPRQSDTNTATSHVPSGRRKARIIPFAAEPVELPRYPRLSPDGRRLALTIGPTNFGQIELERLLARDGTRDVSSAPLFLAHGRQPLTRFGIYKLVRRHARVVETHAAGSPVWCHFSAEVDRRRRACARKRLPPSPEPDQ